MWTCIKIKLIPVKKKKKNSCHTHRHLLTSAHSVVNLKNNRVADEEEVKNVRSNDKREERRDIQT